MKQEPTATVDEAVRAFVDSQCVHYLGLTPGKLTMPGLYVLARLSTGGKANQYGFVCATQLEGYVSFKTHTIEGCIRYALRANYNLHIAPSLSTALNAYDL